MWYKIISFYDHTAGIYHYLLEWMIPGQGVSCQECANKERVYELLYEIKASLRD